METKSPRWMICAGSTVSCRKHQSMTQAFSSPSLGVSDILRTSVSLRLCDVAGFHRSQYSQIRSLAHTTLSSNEHPNLSAFSLQNARGRSSRTAYSHRPWPEQLRGNQADRARCFADPKGGRYATARHKNGGERRSLAPVPTTIRRKVAATGFKVSTCQDVSTFLCAHAGGGRGSPRLVRRNSPITCRFSSLEEGRCAIARTDSCPNISANANGRARP